MLLKLHFHLLPYEVRGKILVSSVVMCRYKTLHSVPRDIDCNLTDFNGDKRTDCLLIGTNDLMCAFDPVSGK